MNTLLSQRFAALRLVLFILAGTAVQAGDFTYVTDNGRLYLLKYIGPGGAVDVPSTINGLPVVGIGSAFSWSTNVTSVTIPESITTIDYAAFIACSALTHVSLPNTITRIGEAAFQDCVSLASVAVPDSVTNVGSEAFYGCLSLTDITIGKSVAAIGWWAFTKCTELTSITVDPLNPAYTSLDGVLLDKGQATLIQYPIGKRGPYAMPLGVTSINDGAFWCGAGLTAVTMANTVTNIGDYAFQDCDQLTRVTMSGNLVAIGHDAFSGCSRLTDIILPAGLTSIGYYAFAYCAGLAEVTIPNSVTNIGVDAFRSCTNLTAITVTAGNPAYSSVDGVLFDRIQTSLIQCPAGKVGAYTIPGSVTNIGYMAFAFCARLTDVAIAREVIVIGNNAFDSCSSLASISIPDSVVTIGGSAFQSCSNITRAVIPDSVTSIGGGAFRWCTGLTNVTIGNSVTNIGSPGWGDAEPLGGFDGCTHLLAFVVADRNPSYRSLDGVLFDKDRTMLIQCPAAKAGEYTVPDSVTDIAYPGFYDCAYMTAITVGKSVAWLWGCAFANCTSLKELRFGGDAPLGLGPNVFEGTTNATVYYLPGTVGWNPTLGGLPTSPWVLPYPVILTTPRGIAIRSPGFRFIFSWATNVPVVIEASTSLENPKWVSLRTNELVGGWSYFFDPNWTNFTSRFYRLRSQ